MDAKKGEMKRAKRTLGFGYCCSALAAAAILVNACAPFTRTEMDSNSRGGTEVLSSCQDVPALTSPRHFERVLIIVFENKDEKEVRENEYFGRLMEKGAYFSNFHGLFHPSYSNYLAMVSGKEIVTHLDGQIDISGTPTVADRLKSKNLAWKNYAEGYSDDGKCHPKPDFMGKYARKHVPFMSFTSIQDNGAECSNIVPGQQFKADWRDHKLPEYAFYTPDLDNDAHDLPLSAAAIWLQGFLDPLLADAQFMKETLVVLTFDESREQKADGGNHIYTLFVGDMVKAGETISANYNHYNVLRTIEDNFGLCPLADGDLSAKPIIEAWK
jgi:hypothetical protein